MARVGHPTRPGQTTTSSAEITIIRPLLLFARTALAEIGGPSEPRIRDERTAAGKTGRHLIFDEGFDEVFAVSRPVNARAEATARRIGMEWVDETEKYYGLLLQVFRLRPGDLSQGVP
jgi:hypothetical protein